MESQPWRVQNDALKSYPMAGAKRRAEVTPHGGLKTTRCHQPHPFGAQKCRICAILSDFSKNHTRNLQYFAMLAFKTHHKINIFFCGLPKHVVK